MKDDISIRMTDTKEGGEQVQAVETEPGETLPEENTSGGRSGSPRRYKLYDRFADRISLRTIDAVILITAVLIVGLLIYGIITGSPR